MSNFPPFRLGGETDPNAWHFSRLGEEGPLPNPVGHTFPLVTHDADGRWRLVGTGFYVNDSGFFVTARHVIEEVCREGRQIAPLLIMHLHSPSGLFGASECHFRPIGQCWTSDVADVAFGAAATATNKITGDVMKNWTWTLSCEVPARQSPVHTYAFPNHIVVDNGRRIRFAPHAYSGAVLSSGEFRDRVMVPFPYIEVDFRIHGGGKWWSYYFRKICGGNQLHRMAREPGSSTWPRFWSPKSLLNRRFFGQHCFTFGVVTTPRQIW